MKLPNWEQIKNRMPTWEKLKGLTALELTVVAIVTPLGVVLSPLIIYKLLKWIYDRSASV